MVFLMANKHRYESEYIHFDDKVDKLIKVMYPDGLGINELDLMYDASDRYLNFINEIYQPLVDKNKGMEIFKANFEKALDEYPKLILELNSRYILPAHQNLDRDDCNNLRNRIMKIDRERRENHNSLVLGLSIFNRVWSKNSSPPPGGLYTLNPKDIYPHNDEIGVGIDTKYIDKVHSRNNIGKWAMLLYIGLSLPPE